MATTNTVTEPVPGITIHSYTALATSDTGPAIDCRGADEVLFQVLSGTLGSATLALQGTLNPAAANYDAGLYDGAQPGVKITGATTGTIYKVAAVPLYCRIVVDAGVGGSGINAVVIVRRRVAV